MKLHGPTAPASSLIEQTAADLAAVYYETGRSQGLHSKYKTHKEFVAAYIENFIPLAIDTLLDILAKPETPVAQKDAISEALMERANSPKVSIFDQKYDLVEKKVGPIVIESRNTAKIFKNVARGK